MLESDGNPLFCQIFLEILTEWCFDVKCVLALTNLDLRDACRASQALNLLYRTQLRKLLAV